MQPPEVLSIALQVLVLFLLLTAAARFYALLKGCYFLRHYGRGRSRDDSPVLLKSSLVPAVSLLAVAREFTPKSRNFVRRLLELHFAQHEVVLVLNGPSGSDLEQWKEEFRLDRTTRGAVRGASASLNREAVRGIYESRDPLKILVIDKAAGSEADALNAGVDAAAGFIALVDSEAEFSPDCLLRLMRALLEDPRSSGAVMGTAPGPVSADRFGAIETLRMWLVRCAAFATWEMLIPVPGAAMLVRRDLIASLGGFKDGATELFVRLHRLGRAKGGKFHMGFVPEPLSYLPMSGSARERRRRIRSDQHSIARAISKAGVRGLGWGLPGLLCARLAMPLAETATYILAIAGLALGWIPVQLGILALLATIGTDILISMAAVVLRELGCHRGSDPAELRRLFLAAIPENLGYHQLRNLWLIADYLGK